MLGYAASWFGLCCGVDWAMLGAMSGYAVRGFQLGFSVLDHVVRGFGSRVGYATPFCGLGWTILFVAIDWNVLCWAVGIEDFNLTRLGYAVPYCGLDWAMLRGVLD